MMKILLVTSAFIALSGSNCLGPCIALICCGLVLGFGLTVFGLVQFLTVVVMLTSSVYLL